MERAYVCGDGENDSWGDLSCHISKLKSFSLEDLFFTYTNLHGCMCKHTYTCMLMFNWSRYGLHKSMEACAFPSIQVTTCNNSPAKGVWSSFIVLLWGARRNDFEALHYGNFGLRNCGWSRIKLALSFMAWGLFTSLILFLYRCISFLLAVSWILSRFIYSSWWHWWFLGL